MSTMTLERQKVYDLFLRLLHAWNGLAIAALLLTAWLSELFAEGLGEKTVWELHIFLGYGLIGGLALRLLWGLIGPRHARFSDMWHPRAWWNALRRIELRPTARFGHHPLAGAAYLGFYALLLVMSLSGLGLAGLEHNMGPLASRLYDAVWFEEGLEAPHAAASLLLIVFFVVHMGALVWHEWKDRVPMAQSMLSGYQYREAQAIPAPAVTTETAPAEK